MGSEPGHGSLVCVCVCLPLKYNLKIRKFRGFVNNDIASDFQKQFCFYIAGETFNTNTQGRLDPSVV